MPVHNSEIANVFQEMADLLELEDENQFRIRAYRNAARTVNRLSQRAEQMIDQGKDLSELEGIGKDLAGKIEEIVKTGKLKDLENLKKRSHSELTELMGISGMGAKKIKKLYEELGIDSVEKLQQAAKEHKIQELERFGEKTEKNILKEIDRSKGKGGRTLLSEAEKVVLPLVEYLERLDEVGKVVIAGSFRRRRETVGDIDILATSKDSEKTISSFIEYEDVEDVISSKGKTRSTVRLRTGLQVDLRVVEEESYGAALLYFTGSKQHSIELRGIARKKKLKINEYGVFKGKKKQAGKTETEIYERFKLKYIEPELREARGEIDAAAKNKLPVLITLDDIKGDLQAHTKDSDGSMTLKQAAEEARKRGYSYFAITDHTTHVGVTQGLDAKGLNEQIDRIDKINDEMHNFHLVKSSEVDILQDGSLDLPDDILKRLDMVVCSVHSNFNLSREKQTERIIRAMDNPCFNIFAHPTGRLIGKRQPYDVDVEKLVDAALERGCYLELNAQPDRLDLNDDYAKMAKDKGLKLSIGTDSHHPEELDFMRYGIGQARRAWLEKDDVLNTRTWTQLKKLLKR